MTVGVQAFIRGSVMKCLSIFLTMLIIIHATHSYADNIYSLRCTGTDNESTDDDRVGKNYHLNLSFTFNESENTVYYFCGKNCLGTGQLKLTSTSLVLTYTDPGITAFDERSAQINRVTGALTSEMKSGRYIGGLYFFSSWSGSCKKVPLVRPPTKKF
jgi:hypothetical protein